MACKACNTFSKWSRSLGIFGFVVLEQDEQNRNQEKLSPQAIQVLQIFLQIEHFMSAFVKLLSNLTHLQSTWFYE